MIDPHRLFAGLVFLAAAAQLLLCLYRFFCRSGLASRVVDTALFLALLLLSAYSTDAALNREFAAAFPWLLLPAVSVFSLAHSAIGLLRAYRSDRETLSPASVKETLDNLNSGILFADASGRVVLVNHTMVRLAAALTGSCPQLLSELLSALDAPKRGVERLEGEGLYRFPDGRVWRFRTVPLSAGAPVGFTQTTAQDMTELQEANERLAQENEALQQANASMRRMLERVADRIREQETLALKMRIRNDIGASLIALSELAAKEPRYSASMDEPLKTLRFAISCFSRDRADIPLVLEDVRLQAERMNIELVLDGYIPQDDMIERLVLAAARECVTNCARHAKGGVVTVKVTELSGICTVTITNDGAVPQGPVTEGGGLSALRRSVERAGGEMHISHSPRFALILNLPKGEQMP